MSHRLDHSPARLADRAAILDVETRWCRAVDRRDYAAMPALFHPDAHDDHGAYRGDIPGLVDWLRIRHEGIVFSMHRISNVLVEFADDDNALVEVYLTVVQRSMSAAQASVPARFVDLVSRSRYVDRLQCRGDEWRILRRIFVPEWRQVVESPATPAPATTIARRGPDDIVFNERRAMGIRDAFSAREST